VNAIPFPAFPKKKCHHHPEVSVKKNAELLMSQTRMF